jgi:hypothetical protein
VKQVGVISSFDHDKSQVPANDESTADDINTLAQNEEDSLQEQEAA